MIDQVLSWKIKHNVKNNQSGDDVVGALRKVNSTLVLCFEKTDEIMKFNRSLLTLFPDSQISTWVYADLNEKMRKRKNGVKESIAAKIRSIHYDLIIDLSDSVELRWLSFVSSLSANIKASFGKEDKYSIFNLMLNIDKNKDNGLDLMLSYLTKIAGVSPEQGF